MSVVTISKILHSTSGVETWLTSDGRAYFVRLQENSQPEEPGLENEFTGEVSPNLVLPAFLR